MKKVYVVLDGEDCEGAHIQAVFEKKEDAIKYIETYYPERRRIAPDEWRRFYVWNGKECRSCTSTFLEEWDVL